MPKIDNVEIHGLDRVFRTAKYPKAADTGSACMSSFLMQA